MTSRAEFGGRKTMRPSVRVRSGRLALAAPVALVALASFATGARGQDAPALDEPRPGLTESLRPGLAPSGDPGREAPPREPFEEVEPETWSLLGDWTQRYRFRSADDRDDQDLFGHLDFDLAYDRPRSEREVPWRRFALVGQGSYTLDIDGFATSTRGASFDPYFDVSNTFDDRLNVFLESLHVVVEDFGALDETRVGRQWLHREVSFQLDGAHLKTERWRSIWLEAFGGSPVHLYENSATGDAVAGATIGSLPSGVLEGLRVQLDYVFTRDVRDGPEAEVGPDREDHFYRVLGRYDPTREWSFSASGSFVGSRDRRQTLEARYTPEGAGPSLFGLDLSGSVLSLRFLRQNGIVEFQSAELSPFFLVEGRYAPFDEYVLDLYQPLGELVAIGGGVQIRALERSVDDSIFNHSFRNYHGSIETKSLWTGFRAVLRGDAWDAEGEDIYTLSIDLEQELGERLRLNAGSSYSLYRFDPFTGTERSRDRVYYGRVRWSVFENAELDTRYQYERDSTTEYHVVTAGWRLSLR